MPSSLLWIARATILGLLIFAVYYPYRLLSDFIPFSFSGPTSWQSHYLVDDTALVPFWGRALHFGFWMPTVIATQVMIFAAIYLVWLIQKNVLFEHRTVRALKIVGAAAAIAGVSALAAILVDGWWVTSWNTVQEQLPIRLHLESGEMGVLFTGLGVFLLALVLDVAVLKKRENEEIV